MTFDRAIDCPLCSSAAKQYHQDRRRTYYQCQTCRLVFVLPEAFLSVAEEKAVYDLHQNGPDDVGYRKFLSRMSMPLHKRLSTGDCGLDFGSGPGPTLSVLFEELGYPMAIYDPFYAPDRSVLADEYDFVTATEVVEHLRRPHASLERMWRCVKPGGYLGLMSKLVIDRAAFANWHYKNDATHICFFSRETFGWLAREWGTAPLFVGKEVTLFRKPKSPGR
jgi:SAM-dependent methyltransferase